jgi:heat shock protein HslJ
VSPTRKTSPFCRVYIRTYIALGVATLVAGCQEANEPAPAVSSDARNTSYIIDGVPVTLVDGISEERENTGASGRTLTRIWGAPTFADLNGDGIEDAVLILTRSTGGSGTFYYVSAAIASPSGQSGTTGLLLGDRIEPKAIDVADGKASIRFMTRGPDQSFADVPTIERARDFVYDAIHQEMVEVAHDFEGEADPDRMTLDMKTWTWIKTEYNNDTTKEPVQKDAFTLTFTDGRLQGTTDCNAFTGAYSVDGSKIHFDDKVAMTRMFCPDSQETDFVAMLLETTSYLFTDQGRLVLELRYDSGGMHFR